MLIWNFGDWYPFNIHSMEASLVFRNDLFMQYNLTDILYSNSLKKRISTQTLTRYRKPFRAEPSTNVNA